MIAAALLLAGAVGIRSNVAEHVYVEYADPVDLPEDRAARRRWLERHPPFDRATIVERPTDQAVRRAVHRLGLNEFSVTLSCRVERSGRLRGCRLTDREPEQLARPKRALALVRDYRIDITGRQQNDRPVRNVVLSLWVDVDDRHRLCPAFFCVQEGPPPPPPPSGTPRFG